MNEERQASNAALIKRLRESATKVLETRYREWGALCIEAADALERQTTWIAGLSKPPTEDAYKLACELEVLGQNQPTGKAEDICDRARLLLVSQAIALEAASLNERRYLEGEIVLQERVTLDEAMLRGFRTYRNGCNFRLRVYDCGSRVELEYGCYCLVNLETGPGELLVALLGKDCKEPLPIKPRPETVAELLKRKPCSKCGGFRFAALSGKGVGE